MRSLANQETFGCNWVEQLFPFPQANRPFGPVANNIYGYSVSAQLQREIADFLESPVAELFEGAGPYAAK
ncbi:MAG: hypothetical protein KKD99_00125 [Proteobacteria bacterium]|nr:hypothetical protein [Pseudomonadota bacterium]MBU4446958.1 hypothetical protein [Pseudomonadota bacterium]